MVSVLEKIGYSGLKPNCNVVKSTRFRKPLQLNEHSTLSFAEFYANSIQYEGNHQMRKSEIEKGENERNREEGGRVRNL